MLRRMFSEGSLENNGPVIKVEWTRRSSRSIVARKERARGADNSPCAHPGFHGENPVASYERLAGRSGVSGPVSHDPASRSADSECASCVSRANS